MWPFYRSRQFVRDLGKNRMHTKDLISLEQSHHQLLFVHDDLKVAHKNNELIKDHGKKVGRGFTQDVFDFRVGRFTGCAVPFMSKEGLRVKGELHAIESRHIPVLDNHYRNGVEFARVRINVLVVDRKHQLLSIGSEEFLKDMPPGCIRTVPELGLRHYTSEPQTCIISAHMYVAMKSFWDEHDHKILQRPMPVFPKQQLLWLPKYYVYPIDRNRCLK